MSFEDLIFDFAGGTVEALFVVFTVVIVMDWFRSMFFKE